MPGSWNTAQTEPVESALRFPWAGVVLFLIGLSSAVEFRLVGTLFAADLILLAALLPLLIYRAGHAPWRLAGPILGLLVLWLLGQIATDVVRASPFENYARGWAKIVFFGTGFLSVLLLSGARIGRLMAFFAGLAAAQIISTAFFPDAYEKALPWKFGYAAPVGILAAITASVALKGMQAGAVRRYGFGAVLGAVNLVANFRSLFVMELASVGVTAVTDLARRLKPGQRLASPAFALVFAIVALVGAIGATTLYSSLAERGVLGSEAKAKYDQQSAAGLGVLIGGRSEILISAQAIADSPILGHGSWAADRGYVAQHILMLRERGVGAQGSGVVSELIPSHSYLLGAWVESGMAGGVFWMVVLVLTGWALISLVDTPPLAVPFAAFAIVQLLWSIPFSPFGADVRFMAAGQICVVIWALRAAWQRQAEP